MKYLKRYLAENLRWLAVILFIALTMTTTMLLNEISLKEIAYGLLLCGFLTILQYLWDTPNTMKVFAT